MAAQNQARMAGVSYDVIDESQLTNINNLIGYDALIFPSMADVNTAQLPAIMSTLTSAVYNYHIGIITSGDFLTNDQTGARTPRQLLRQHGRPCWVSPGSTGGNSGDVTVTANDVSNPIMEGYTAGQVIQTYANVKATPPTRVGRQPQTCWSTRTSPVSARCPALSKPRPAAPTFISPRAALLGDSNLLSNAIQSVVLGTQPGVALHTSRRAGIVAARMDMDQSQIPADVSPAAAGLASTTS